jgi:hypothetical protein
MSKRHSVAFLGRRALEISWRLHRLLHNVVLLSLSFVLSINFILKMSSNFCTWISARIISYDTQKILQQPELRLQKTNNTRVLFQGIMECVPREWKLDIALVLGGYCSDYIVHTGMGKLVSDSNSE